MPLANKNLLLESLDIYITRNKDLPREDRLNILDTMTIISPRDSAAHHSKSRLLFEMGHYDDALTSCNLVFSSRLHLTQNFTRKALITKGGILTRTGKFTEAKRSFESARLLADSLHGYQSDASVEIENELDVLKEMRAIAREQDREAAQGMAQVGVQQNHEPAA